MKKFGQLVAGMTVGATVASMIAPSAFALGFRNPDQSARATAQGEAFVAQADDASAIYYNPAGLTQVKGTQTTFGGNLLFREVRFSGTGASDKLDASSLTPNLFMSTDFGLNKWRFGVGAYVPFGNTMDWGSGPFSTIVRDSQLIVYDIAPTVAYQVNDHLSLGAGLNYYHGSTELKYDFSPLIPGSRSKFEGDGDAFGATAGLMWKINDQHTIGIVYRSPFTIDFDGRAKDVNAGPFTTSAHASAEINFPQEVAGGYAFRPIKNLKLEVDIEWTNWESLDNVRLHTKDPIIAGDPRTNIPFHWRDSFFYEFGTQYDLNKNWALRGGYIYSENSVPTHTFSPSVPDANKHVFSAGIGYDSKDKAVLFSKAGLSVDLSYQYTLGLERKIGPGSNNVASPLLDGTWKSSSHAVMLTSTVKF
jgi:long-chain fatty acid transport protein